MSSFPPFPHLAHTGRIRLPSTLYLILFIAFMTFITYNIDAVNQAQILRRMSGIERMEKAFQLSDFVIELARQNIKSQLGKKATRKKIQEELRKRLKY